MDFQQIQKQWQQHQQQSAIQGETTMNAASLMQQYEYADKQARERTLYGSLAFGLIMIFLVIFNYFLYLIGAPVSAIASIASWFFVLLMNGARLWLLQQQQPTKDKAVGEHLEHKLEFVEQEKRFYLSLWKWLTLPLGMGLCALMLSLQSDVQSIDLLYLVAYIVFAVVGHNHCKKIVKHRLQPLAEQLKAARKLQ